MRKLRPLTLLIVLASLFMMAKADAPPEAGYKRIKQNLMIESQEDLGDYRFFMKVGADLREFTIKVGERIEIEPMGGGSYYRNGVFLAVPKKSLVGLSEVATDKKLDLLQQAIYDGKVSGTIELIKHGFIRDVPNAEAATAKDPVYRIEKDAEKILKATLVSGGVAESKVAASAYSTDPKSAGFWVTVVGGALMTLAFITFGVWAIRRSNKPRRMNATTK